MSRIVFPTLRTGGVLNRINERFGLNQAARTVPVMKLVGAHKPLHESQLIRLLDTHAHPGCDLCNCRVNGGGLVGWAETLYRTAHREGHVHIAPSECDNFVYDLFVRGPLRGRQTEMAALVLLRELWSVSGGHVQFCESTPEVDSRFAVDIVMAVDHKDRAGIQVKPESYRKTHASVHGFNEKKNREWGLPVAYMYYDRNGFWTNVPEVMDGLKKTLADLGQDDAR